MDNADLVKRLEKAYYQLILRSDTTEDQEINDAACSEIEKVIKEFRMNYEDRS